MDKTITDLPKEVLFDIFEKITEADDRRSLALVCKGFYEIIRRQSANSSKISIDWSVDDILSIFANCPIFHFRTLHMKVSSYVFTENQEKWIFAGQNIKTLIMDYKIYNLPQFLHAVKTFFPKLEELQISDYRNAGAEALQNPEEYRNDSLVKLQLVEQKAEFSIAEVNFFLRCYPNLKILDIFIRPEVLEMPEFAEIVSNWCSQVAESVCLDIYTDETQYSRTVPKLSTIARLQETKKLCFWNLEISMRDEDIETFFSCPRKIHGLILHHCEDSTVEKLQLIAKNATVTYLFIIGEFPDFEEAEGLFVSFQNLKTIEITYDSHFFNVHTPSAVFLSKIDIMKREKMRNLNRYGDIEGDIWPISPNFIFWLHDAHNLETLHLPDEATDEVLQVIIRNCPKLKEFHTNTSGFTEDGLLGTAGGDSLCISELKELETLRLEVPNSFADRTLIEAIRFPKLKTLILSGGKYLSFGGLAVLANNCPKLEMIRFEKCSFVPNCSLNQLMDIFKSADNIKFRYCFNGVLQVKRATLVRNGDEMEY